jgi:hypothetical protein
MYELIFTNQFLRKYSGSTPYLIDLNYGLQAISSSRYEINLEYLGEVSVKIFVSVNVKISEQTFRYSNL